ncbi:MAG: peptidylprolyl isomerase [Methanosarcinales archaeon]|nr:peptidylprolyl isomerase [Methanosarcinales archaeon]
MTIKEGDFIKLSYTGKLDDGSIFDTTDEELAKANDIFNENAIYGGDIIIIGAKQTIEGLEEDIKKHDIGYEGTIEIPPEKGFGEKNPLLIKSIPVKRFEQKPHEGMQVQIDGRVGLVMRVMGRHARVDFNAPMASKTIYYDYKINDVLENIKDKAVGLSTLYTGKEMDIEIDGTIAKVQVPLEYSYNQRWLYSKGQMSKDLLKNTELTEVQLIETYTMDFLKDTPEKE